jgi:hypothetical protein
VLAWASIVAPIIRAVLTTPAAAPAGSVFTVRLPAGADSPARTSAGSNGSSSARADCVLVIDDDATARELISDHLKAEGFSVVTVPRNCGRP